MQEVSVNKYVLPAKDFVSSNVAGHINSIKKKRFCTQSQESPIVPEQMRGSNYFISHLRPLVSERGAKALIKL